MKEDYSITIEKALVGVPKGTFEIESYASPHAETPLLTNHLDTQTEGKGKIEAFLIYPGIEVSFNQFLADKVLFHHEAINSVLEITHCRMGRVGWNMKSGISVYLGTGDLALHSMDCCADSDMTLPLGYYEGITISIDLNILADNSPEILKEGSFNARQLYEKFCTQGKPAAIPSSSEIDRIFSSLYDLPDQLRIPYYKLKVQELLLYLSRINPAGEKELTQYFSQQTELIKEIHGLLTHHLDQRFTIEELSKQYLINTSSLKAVFKAVYGLPIATYMKEYRVKQAKKLLRTTDDSIADIASSVGYETQGKFTNAFKNIVRMLPTEYRKQHRSQE
ncbi:helix-turn-helix domain-containing protein [Clostridium sp. Marseille-P2415]|uniref:helix-turn-helix domain-containing protein n=1 Tax=Clostridium sp. Marseille-P2415 TaxID=1805471 RepID=UPI0009886142|nr:AraC family transcriptional regulator [Clostridium sp. Marseille-P2415]